MTKKRFYALYILCTLFSLSAAFNEGMTGFFWGIPFYLGMVKICIQYRPHLRYRLLAILIIVSSITTNLTLGKNPLYYPILSQGTVTFPNDGFIIRYSDDSAGFTTNPSEYSPVGGNPPTFTPVKAGDVFEVKGVKLNYPDFGLNRSVVTTLGSISEKNEGIILNKEVVGPLHYLGALMYYPIIPVIIFTTVTSFIQSR